MMQRCHQMPAQALPRGSVQHPHRRLPHLLFLLFLYSLTWCSSGVAAQTKKESSPPLLGTIPDTAFRCRGHSAGYYADPDTGCQVYHMCDGQERQYSYLCPNYTLFNQKFMVCDHWHMVNCSSSHTYYHLNSHIGEVPDKTEDGEAQNTIPAGRGDAASTRSKGSPSRTPLLAAGRPAAAEPSNRHRKGTTSPQPAFKHSATRPVKATVFKTPTKPVTPSTTFSIRTSTTKPSTPSHRQFATPLTTRPNAPPSRQPFTSPTVKPRQSFNPVSREPVLPPITLANVRTITPTRQPLTSTRQPDTPTRQPVFPPTRQPTSATRRLFTPLTRQPVTATPSTPVTQTKRQPVTQPTRKPVTQPTRKPVTQPTRKPVTQPTRKPVTQPTRKPVTQPTRQPVTQRANHFSKEVTVTNQDVQRPPSTLFMFTLPKIEFSNHSVDRFRGNNQESNVDTSSTPKHSINSSLSLTNKLTPPRVAHSHTPQERDPLAQTEQPSTGFTRIPGRVARKPGNKFSFTSRRVEDVALTPEELQRLVFQPLLARPRTKTRRILTSPPSLLPIDPADSSDPHHHHFPMRIEFPDPVIPEDSSSRSSLDLKLSNSQGTQTPPRVLEPPAVSPAVHSLASFLSLPAHPFTPIAGMKQEFPTPLATPQSHHNLRTSPRDTFLPGTRRLPFPTSARSNRKFFIPSAEFPELSLLVSELPRNIVEEPARHPNHSEDDHHHHHHHMTMVFPAPIEPSMMEELKLNPECPRCHPEFLKPGQCNPCVVIK